MMNFYRRFLPCITGTLRLLTSALSGNPKALPWKPDMETSFPTAKAAMAAAQRACPEVAEMMNSSTLQITT
jgi:hypothetical protein